MADWIWEKENWTDFQYNASSLMGYDTKFEFNGKNMLSGIVRCDKKDQSDFLGRFEIEITGNEAFFTSEIEGEHYNQESLRADLSYHFSRLANVKGEDEKIGVTKMMADLFATFDEPLSHGMLHRWNASIVKGGGNTFLGQVKTAGAYREEEEIITSYKKGREVVDYEALPYKDVPKAMDEFVEWFNDTGPNGSKPLPPLIRAGLAHLYFVTIHPYEDGNGRISRALAEKALSQYWGKPTLISLSHAISNDKKRYYDALESATSAKFSGGTQEWLEYFCEMAVEAQKITREKLLQSLVRKEIEDKHDSALNETQKKVVKKMVDAISNSDGFVGGLTAKKYKALAGKACRSKEQAFDEIRGLEQRGVLKRPDPQADNWVLDVDNNYDCARRSMRKNSQRPAAAVPSVSPRERVPQTA